jgi:acyl carrier protein
MTSQEALTWVGEIFEEAPGRIAATTTREEIPGWDSLGTLSLIAALDERFDIQLSEDEIEGLKTVDDIFGILRRVGALEA